MDEHTHKFDLHMHSDCSDGADTPAQVVQNAVSQGLSLAALTDHDSVAGVSEALVSGCAQGIAILPAVEMDTEWPNELHILGLDVDVGEPGFVAMLETARQRRIARNAVIYERLAKAGYNIADYIDRPAGSTTRLHIALALVKAGYADNTAQAFDRYLRRGCIGHYTVPRFTPEEVVAALKTAHGVPVWAHPFHGGENIHKTFDMLCASGICGIEAYHPSATAGQSEILVSLAHQKRLIVTCGSDSHGANRPSVKIGCTWRDTPELNETYAFFMARLAQ